jgi:hypothetical protein
MQKRIKYPKTPSLPWSPGCQEGKLEVDLTAFRNKKIVLTEKMDGECFSLYVDGLHARSLDSKHHPSQSWIKAKHAELQGYIPYRFRICGENMYAKHSIGYDNLDSYFYIFSIWNGDHCMDWEYTVQWAEHYKLSTPHVFWIGIFDEEKLRKMTSSIAKNQEGYVIRNHSSFKFKDFQRNVAKWVRPNHVQTDIHWSKNWTKNELKR